VSGEAGRLGGSACPFKDRRRGNGEANGSVSSLGAPLACSLLRRDHDEYAGHSTGLANHMAQLTLGAALVGVDADVDLL